MKTMEDQIQTMLYDKRDTMVTLLFALLPAGVILALVIGLKALGNLVK